jgi:IclR family transcriptional regulator, pca regulon regulatory protein
MSQPRRRKNAPARSSRDGQDAAEPPARRPRTAFDSSTLAARYFVQSLERGLAVIRAFGPEHPELTVTEVARETHMTTAAARRFLLTLRDLGYVHTDGRFFRLRPRVLELGYAYLSGLSLPEVALPHVERLVAEVEESSEMAVLDGDEIVYIMRVPGPRILTVSVNVGARMPAHATSLGRALLAGLPDDSLDAYLADAELKRYSRHTLTDRRKLRSEIIKSRRRGWATIDQELEAGLVAVAVPIRDPAGRILAALNLSTNVARRSLESLVNGVLPALTAAATEIEADLQVTANVEGIRG